MRKRRRAIYLIVAAAAVTALIFTFNFQALLSAAGRWLDVGVAPRRADAVVLLNGGYNTRPFVAAALVRGGWTPKVLLSTVAVHPMEANGALPPSREIELGVLKYAGVRRSEVTLLDVSAKTTYDEAKAVSAYLADHPAKRLLLVTEAPHTRRARWIFERVLTGQRPEIVVVSAPTDGFDYSFWWRSENGFLFVVSEYFKFFFYALYYGWLGYEIIAAAVAVLLLSAWFQWRRKPDSSESVIY